MSIDSWKEDFYQSILGTALQPYLSDYAKKLEIWDNTIQHADQKRWEKQLKQLPNISETKFFFGSTVSFGEKSQLTQGQHQHLESVLKQFMPWRKGPFSLFGHHIDTEWRSDFKWDRVLPGVGSLKNKRVLDVGCGSGYHLFRMYERGATQVVGVDPTTLFFYQFHCFKQYVPELNIHYLPLMLEDLPACNSFDTVFSMGVLYHRLDPLLFLKQLKHQLRAGGELILETLVIEGDQNQVLCPQGRYAQMRNVYFIPSTAALCVWLEKVGFKQVTVIEENVTTTDEQRATEWMTNHSLKDFLNPNDNSLTVEGLPAPRRATVRAIR